MTQIASPDLLRRAASSRTLPDDWDPEGGLPLDGTLERHRFPPLLAVLFGLIFVFVVFQLVIAPVAVVVLLLARGTPPEGLMEAVLNVMQEQPGVLMVANTIGQVFGIALPALWFARLHTRRQAAFLRLRRPEGRLVGLAVLGLVALVPVVQWLAQASEALPWPEWIREFEQVQLDLIEKVLEQQIGLLPTLFMLAVTPALCEELLFRGYVQRQAERSLGVAGGILFTGLLFGLFHLRLTQFIPLSVLGIYLAYLAWRTGSLWPAVVVHFANNAFAVFLGAYVAARPDLNVSDLENVAIPWYVLIPALVFFVLFVYAIDRTARMVLRRRGPVAAASRGRVATGTESFPQPERDDVGSKI
ncbi:CPBP family intramembrane metalloprotease [Rhodocaloribacter litoris]|uniref:CPBP family intramembrane glutamic endopeptidase n=1 Tax=Rhodocaloribacter litoris TaxID=2558931 RepID=UPI001420F5B9|nr:CPBP family intramembrane glutamic endopeptidase [Rhodocaloribacter litoris]QXD15718.1 CPBP family intramembrane metalloprotease [Rhodocaloribacter litoris]